MSLHTALSMPLRSRCLQRVSVSHEQRPVVGAPLIRLLRKIPFFPDAPFSLAFLHNSTRGRLPDELDRAENLSMCALLMST